MANYYEQQAIARNLDKPITEKVNVIELRRLYKETIFQQFISMNTQIILALVALKTILILFNLKFNYKNFFSNYTISFWSYPF